MKKLLISENMGEYEKEHKRASYRTLVEYYIGDIVLCNNIINIDESIYDNMTNGIKYVNYNTGEECTEEDYYNDENGKIEIEYPDIFQCYLCNLTECNRELAEECGLILSYSDVLECNVLCVDHFGTSWDYVLTDVELVDNYEDL